jgi:hypothetical protein
MGTITQGNWNYTLTPEDRLWAGRMITGEGAASEAPAVLWTMTQLFAPAGQQVKYGHPNRFPTFTSLIRAYSQPINPIWAADGSKCRPGGDAAGTANCDTSKLARRDSIAAMPLDAMEPAKRVVLDKWFAGWLPNPVPNAIEFAAPNVSRSFLGRNPAWSALTQAGNWFLRPPVDLPPAVMNSGVPLAPVLGATFVGVGLLFAAGAAYWYYKRR